MQDSQCRNCGSGNVRTKEIQVRHINSQTMGLSSTETVYELECKACGWVVTAEKAACHGS